MSDFDSTSSSSIDLNDLLRSVDSLVSQLDRCGAEIATRFQSRLDDETMASVVTHSEESAEMELEDQVDELISDAIDAVDSLDEEISEPSDVTDQDEQAVDDLAAQVDEMIADAEDVVAVEEVVDSDEEDGAEEITDTMVDDSEPPTAEAVAKENVEENIDSKSLDVETSAADPEIATDTEIAAEEPSVDDTAVEEVGVADEAGSADEVSVDATFDAATDVIEEAAAETPPTVESETIESIDSAIESEAESVEDDLDEPGGEFASIDEIEESELPTTEPASEAPAVDDSTTAKAGADDHKKDTAEVAKGSGSTLRQLIAHVRSLPASLKEPGDNQIAQSMLLVLTPMARPLTKLDPKVRDTIGWVAINTLFIAICLWIFLILR